jgi:hypothetical protein
VLLEFSGEIEVSTVVPEGTPFFGQIRYDSTMSPRQFTTFYEVPDYSFTLGANEFQQTGDDQILHVVNDHSVNGMDNLYLFNGTFTGPEVDGATLRTSYVDIRDSDGIMLSSDALPTSLDFDLTDFRWFTTSWTTPTGLGISNGQITSLSITAVPEPGSAVLLACAGVVLVLRRRKPSNAV